MEQLRERSRPQLLLSRSPNAGLEVSDALGTQQELAMRSLFDFALEEIRCAGERDDLEQPPQLSAALRLLRIFSPDVLFKTCVHDLSQHLSAVVCDFLQAITTGGGGVVSGRQIRAAVTAFSTPSSLSAPYHFLSQTPSRRSFCGGTFARRSLSRL
jgi:hypothetical protein